MYVTVVWPGADNRRLDLPEGSTGGQALNAVGCPGGTFSINGRMAQASETLRDGDTLTVAVVNGKVA